MKPRVDEEQALRHLRLLNLPLHELRCIQLDGRIVRGWFNDREALAETACGMSKPSEGSEVYGGIYVTVNELESFFEEFVDDEMRTGASTKAENVLRYRNLVMDIDPNKPESAKKCAATAAEHAAVLQALEKAKALSPEHGLPEPALIDSGNGGYPIYRIDLPNSEESENLIQRVFVAFGKLLDNDGCHVDQSVFDPSRIFRLAGTINRKGTATMERPFRGTKIISAPQTLELVTKDQLIAFTEKVLGSDWLAPVKCDDDFDNLPKSEFDKRVEVVVEWLKRAGRKDVVVVPKAKCTAINFTSGCPFKDVGHRDGGSGVVVWKNGKRAFSCLHDKCATRNFAELETKLKLKFQTVAEEFATTELYGGTNRVFDDPRLLAQRHLSKWATKDGLQTLAYFRGETYRYEVGGWEFVRTGELDPWILDTVQQSFDEHAKIVSKITGEEVKPQPIRGTLVADVYKQMQSICRHEIARNAQAPFWLGQHDWNPDDLFVFRNGILNVRRYIEGQSSFFIDPTPKLFFLHAAAFDFSQQVTRPERWLTFLDSLGQPPEWHTALQQVMGYLLWAGYDLQKYFQFVGPKRAGKGIVAGVLSGLQGGKHSVCSLGLEDFATTFGLEDAIDKRLAIIPEATLPSKGMRKIVSTFKAITGGDMVPVNRKRIKQVSLRLLIKIILLTNEFLVLPDGSGAMHARTFPLKFTKSFFGQEDVNLADNLKTEYPAIFNWALEGIRSLLAAGGRFTVPQSTQEELDQLEAESAPLQDFVDECCDIDTTKGCHSASLYIIYKAWHRENHPGENLLADNTFADELKKTAYTIVKGRLNHAGEDTCKGRKIIKTVYDKDNTRAGIWLNIIPKEEWRSKSQFAA